MAAYASGDAHAFEELFARLAPRVHAFFLRAFRSTAVAEELMQVTFLKLHKARTTYRPGLPLRPWLFTIAARVRGDERRRRSQRPEDEFDDALEVAAEHDPQAPPQEAALIERDLVARVRAALDALPESQRVVLQLHRYEELTFAQIASVLGTSEGAVRVRACRAYETLRRLLGGALEEDAT
ncbi:MAG: sigma-70 family RNA polymerase sigma factor [Myxococcales bacterium]